MKKWILPTRLEWLSFLIIMPLVSLLINFILFDARLFRESSIWYYSIPCIFLLGLLSWYLQIFFMQWLHKRFTQVDQTPTRLILLCLSHISITVSMFCLIFLGYDAFGFLEYQLNKDTFQYTIVIAIALNIITTTFWESDYTFKQLKTSLSEKEKLQQLSLQQEFDSLKSQVNPHFLFNCFNTLSSLISEDKEAAEVFLNELSKVYRYLLRNNRTNLTSLENELRFIHSYFQLLQTRYGGEAVQLHIEVDKRYEQYVLPSSSLQLLVENAVKHNVVSKSSPLIIDIFTAAGNILVVNNNLQTKQSKPMSTHIGLENIRAKYDLINQTGFQVLADTKNFSVILPLIWYQMLESSIDT